MMYKTLYRKLKIDQHGRHKNRNDKQFLLTTWYPPFTFVTTRGRRDHDRMIVGFTTTCAISVYHH